MSDQVEFNQACKVVGLPLENQSMYVVILKGEKQSDYLNRLQKAFDKFLNQFKIKSLSQVVLESNLKKSHKGQLLMVKY